jgi:hypothetical protein
MRISSNPWINRRRGWPFYMGYKKLRASLI